MEMMESIKAVTVMAIGTVVCIALFVLPIAFVVWCLQAMGVV